MKKFLTMFFILYMVGASLFAQVPKEYQGEYTSNQTADGRFYDPPSVFDVEENTIALNGKVATIEEMEILDGTAYILLSNGVGLKYNPDDQILYIVNLETRQLLWAIKLTKTQGMKQIKPLEDLEL